MNSITWGHQCYFCHRLIRRGKPTLVCSLDKPGLMGISHAKCAQDKYSYGNFWTSPPCHLSSEQVSFLVQFFPRLYALPGWDKPKNDLRRCAASMLLDYPGSLNTPTKCLQEFREGNTSTLMLQPYEGDLEADFLAFLGQVQRATKENPLDIEIDLPKP
jgi:hypothetical protein